MRRERVARMRTAAPLRGPELSSRPPAAPHRSHACTARRPQRSQPTRASPAHPRSGGRRRRAPTRSQRPQRRRCPRASKRSWAPFRSCQTPWRGEAGRPCNLHACVQPCMRGAGVQGKQRGALRARAGSRERTRSSQLKRPHTTCTCTLGTPQLQAAAVLRRQAAGDGGRGPRP